MLITLGIIGVVAAITMPNLMSHLTKQKLKSQFFKAYAELNRAARTFYANEDIPFKDYQDTLYNGSVNSTVSLERFMAYYKGQQIVSLEQMILIRIITLLIKIWQVLLFHNGLVINHQYFLIW